MRGVAVYAIATLSLVAAAALAGCGSGDSISGEVRFHRDVELPEGATVTVTLWDTSIADGPALILGREVILDAVRLPVRFRIEYEPEGFDQRNEYTLGARVESNGELLYINDTVHPVLTGGNPRNSDVRVISTDPFDQCVAPLPVQIHSGFREGDLPDDAALQVRLWDVTDPERRELMVEGRYEDLGEFPLHVELPHEGVAINRHHRYELEAEVWFDDELQMHIPNAEWRKTILPHCPNDDLLIVNDVFPVSEFPAE